MTWTRPSALHRALECPASTALPTDTDASSPSAEWGTEVHAWKAGAAPTTRVATWLSSYEDVFTSAEGIRTQTWPGGEHEVMLKETKSGGAVRALYTDEEARQAFKADADIMGVADWIGDVGGVTVDDLKTGREAPCETPSDLPQMMWYGSVLSRLLPGEPGVNLRITHWPRYPKGGLPAQIGPEFVSRDRFEEWRATLLEPARLRAKQPDAAFRVNPGAWCLYCPSTPYCPVYRYT